MINKKVIIVSPGSACTGGIELLHQLADLLNMLTIKSNILYYPFARKHQIPKAYSKYNIIAIDINEIVIDECVFVIPEIYTYLVSKFDYHRTIIWWMSVDNYLNSSSLLFSLKNKFFPCNYLNVERKADVFNSMLFNLYQSNYAKIYLENNGINRNIMPLGDYINEDFVIAHSLLNIKNKNNIIVYNPAKGFKTTNKLISALGHRYTFISIVNMSRKNVIDLLLDAKVYIDFGNHPGKDRIPREAVILGCIILTNKSGSANNNIDIPISNFYKLNETEKNFIDNFNNVVSDIFENYQIHFNLFNDYRNRILQEKKEFEIDVLKIFNEKNIG